MIPFLWDEKWSMNLFRIGLVGMDKLGDPWNAFAKKMVETPKIVFTKTLTKSNWINTEIAKGDSQRRNYQVKEPRWEGHTRLWGCLVRFFLD